MSVPEKLGLIVCSIGALLTALNLYVGPIRYLVVLLGRRPRSEWHYSSGVPVFGSMLLWIGALLLIGKPAIMWSAIGLSLLDYCGLHWFVGTMIYMTWFRRS